VTIDWMAFLTVVVAAAVSAGLLVTLFSLALRVGDSPSILRRIASLGLWVLCVVVVLFGIFLIVPALHAPFGL
jgi:hypothetical protein